MNDAAQDLREKRLDMWESIFWQCSIPIELGDVDSVIDFGSGRNLTKAILGHYGIQCTTVDVMGTYGPDLVAPITLGLELLPADLVCSFQCLEHNPYEVLTELMSTLTSYAKKYVLISLPYDGGYVSWRFALRIPFLNIRKKLAFQICGLGGRAIDISKLDQTKNPYQHHYWEVGRRGYSVKKVVGDVERATALKLLRRIQNSNYPHHIFLLFEKEQ